MNYEGIKTHSERCAYDHLMIVSRLHDEIAELRDYIEAQIKKYPVYTSPPQRKPLSDEEILATLGIDRYDTMAIETARIVERAHGIGSEE